LEIILKGFRAPESVSDRHTLRFKLGTNEPFTWVLKNRQCSVWIFEPCSSTNMLGKSCQKANQSSLLGIQLCPTMHITISRSPQPSFLPLLPSPFLLRCYLCPSCGGQGCVSQCQGAVSASGSGMVHGSCLWPRLQPGMMRANGHFFHHLFVFGGRPQGLAYLAKDHSLTGYLEVIPWTLGILIIGISSVSSSGGMVEKSNMLQLSSLFLWKDLRLLWQRISSSPW
jgi:hypothetical protein